MKCPFCNIHNGEIKVSITIKKSHTDIFICLHCARGLAIKVGIDPTNVYLSDPTGYDI